MDRDCSVWDRQIHLTVQCVGSAPSEPVEIGRWINSFARKGHWVTASPFAPLLVHPNGDSTLPAVCNFTTSVGMGDHWLTTLKLRFPLVDNGREPGGGTHASSHEAVHPESTAMMMPTSVVPLVFPNNGQGFSSKSYNANRTISIGSLIPAGTLCLIDLYFYAYY